MIRLGNNKINKMDYADIPINKAYYGDRLVHITYGTEDDIDVMDYVTVPNQLASNEALKIPLTIWKGATYEFIFTPIDFDDSYYGYIIGGYDDTPEFGRFGLYKLDNGWGTTCNRTSAAIGNYDMSNRVGYACAGEYCINNGVKITVTMHCDDEKGYIRVTDTDGQDSTATSSTVYRSSLTDVFDTEFQMPIFGRGSVGGTLYSTANINFHRFRVTDKDGKLKYDYAPVNEEGKPIIMDLVSGNKYKLPFIDYK